MGSDASSCMTVATRRTANDELARPTGGEANENQSKKAKLTQSQPDVQLATAAHPVGAKARRTTKSCQASGRDPEFIVGETIGLGYSKLKIRTPGCTPRKRERRRKATNTRSKYDPSPNTLGSDQRALRPCVVGDLDIIDSRFFEAVSG